METLSLYGREKDYLSYSAIDKWLKSPEQYRKQYYKQRPTIVTPELAFGKSVATLLENADASMSHVKQYSHPEYQINVSINGVPFFGFIDSFDPATKSILEYKTGKQPWTQARVDKHLQLALYSLSIELLEGEVNNTCELIWLETRKVEKKSSGLISHEESYGIELTGRVETFERTITKAEREETAALITKVADEIARDYAEYKKTRERETAGLR